MLENNPNNNLPKVEPKLTPTQVNNLRTIDQISIFSAKTITKLYNSIFLTKNVK